MKWTAQVRGRSWTLQDPIEGPRRASSKAVLKSLHPPPLPPPHYSSHCTCPVTPRRACWEWVKAQAIPQTRAGSGPAGAALDADRCPGTHPRLERLRGGKAQLRTALLSRSRAPRSRSWSGCSRCGRCPLVGFAKSGEGQEVDAATARAAGRGKRALGLGEPLVLADVRRAGSKQHVPLPALCRGQRRASCWRDPHAPLYPMGRPEKPACVTC